jgi:RHS repeat-associated protein
MNKKYRYCLQIVSLMLSLSAFNAGAATAYYDSNGPDGETIYYKADSSILLLHGEIITPISYMADDAYWKLTRTSSGWQYTSIKQQDWNAGGFDKLAISGYGIQYMDFDGDGVKDILLRAPSSRQDSFVLYNNKKLVTFANSYDLSLENKNLVIRDVNADGKLDIVLADGFLLNAGTAFWNTEEDNTAPLPSSAVGSTTASFRVDEQGGVSYSVPINIPAGRGNIKPELALSYSSSTGGGLLGMGWNLSGPSSISRCPKNMAQDGTISGLTFGTNDRLCLDGQRLFPKGYDTKNKNISNAAYWAATNYYTETNSAQTITASSPSSAGPDHFIIENKAGEKYYFGLNNSYSGNVIKSTAKQLIWGSITSGWNVTRIADISGNYIDYQYQIMSRGEVLLTEMSYGGNINAGLSATNKISLDYIDDSQPRYRFLNGAIINHSKLLKRISLTIDNDPVRQYEAFYNHAVNLNNVGAEIGNQTFLTSIQECTGDISNTGTRQCLTPLSFEWTKPTRTSTNSSASPFSPQTETIAVPGGIGDKYNTRIADITGDGIADILFIRGNEWYMQDGSDKVVRLLDSGDSLSNTLFIDWNGDSVKDLLIKRAGKWTVLAFSPQKRSVPQITCPAQYNCPTLYKDYYATTEPLALDAIGYEGNAVVMDVDGDGLEDLVYQQNGAIYGVINKVVDGKGFRDPVAVKLLDAMATVTNGKIQTSYSRSLQGASMVDVNGDGRSDLTIQQTTTSTTFACGRFVGSSSWQFDAEVTSNDECNRKYATVTHGWSQVGSAVVNYSWRAYISDGTSLQPYAEIASSSKSITLNPADFNGDGLTDFAYKTDNIWYSKIGTGLNAAGSAFGSAVKIEQIKNETAEAPTQFVDINGDGATDILVPTLNSAKTSSDIYLSTQPALQAIDTGALSDSALLQTTTRLTLQARQQLTHLEGVMQFADYQGDGQLDMIVVTGDGIRLNRNLRSNMRDNVITRFNTATGALGGATTVTYGQATNPNLYLYNESTQRPADHARFRNITGNGLFLVSEVTSEAPAGSVSVSYQYGGGMFDTQGRGFLGFEMLSTLSGLDGVLTRTVYNQHFPLTGMADRTTRYLSSGEILSSATNEWHWRNSSPVAARAASFQPDWDLPDGLDLTNLDTDGNRGVNVYLAHSVEKNYDLNSHSLLTTTDTTINQDDWGNVTAQTIKLSDTQGNTFITQSLNEYNGAGGAAAKGRLSCAAVIKTRGDSNTALPSGLGGCSTLTASSSAAYQLKKSTFGYTDAGLLSSSTEGSSAMTLTTNYLYDAIGNIIRETRSGTGTGTGTRITSRDFAGSRYLASESVSAQGSATTLTTRYQYNGVDAASARGFIRKITKIDANGVTSHQTQDPFGLQSSSYSNDGSYSSAKKEACGSVSCPSGALYRTVGSSNSGVEQYAYFDKFGLEILQAKLLLNGRYSVVSTQYDKASRPTSTHGPIVRDSPYETAWGNNPITTSSYDILGRLISQYTSGFGTTYWAYNGFTTTQANPLNQIRVETTNGNGELIKVMDNKSQELLYSYSYDATGLQTTVSSRYLDANGQFQSKQLTSTHTDLQGNKDRMNDLTKGQWTYSYNAFGELLRQKDARGNQTDLSYDGLGRLLRKTITVSTDSHLNQTICYRYDGAPHGIGKLYQRWQLTGLQSCDNFSNGEYAEQQSYDALSRPSNLTTWIGLIQYEISNQYDTKGRLDSVLYPADNTGKRVGFRNVYQNGAVQEILQIDSNGTSLPIRTITAVDAQGHVLQEKLGNGVTTTRVYDDLQGTLRAISIAPATTNGVNIVQNYGYNVLGNLISRDATAAGSWYNWQGVHETFTYDSLNRLSSRSHSQDPRATLVGLPAMAAVAKTTETFSYDGLGNLLSKSGNAYRYSATNPYQLQQVGTKTLSYDANGNVLSDGARTMTYNGQDQLTRISKGDSVTEFFYGPDGNRYKRHDLRTENQSGIDVSTHSLAGYDRIITLDKDGRHVTHRYNLPGLSYIYYENTDVTQRFYNHSDHLGSIIAISNEDGKMVEQRQYDAWGKSQLIASGPSYASHPWLSAITPRGYTGHEEVDELGIIHMNGRIYDADIGRFLQADPFVQAPTNLQNFNRYSYVLNNPLNMTDPSGFFFSGLKHFVKKNWKTLAAIAVSAITYGAASGWAMSLGMTTSTVVPGSIAAYAPGLSLGGAVFASSVAGAIGGAVGGALTTGSIKGAAQGALVGTIMGATTGFVGYGGVNNFGDFSSKLAASSVGNCAAGEISGGSCGQSVKSSLFSTSISLGMTWYMGNYGYKYKPSWDSSDGEPVVKVAGDGVQDPRVTNVGMSIEIPYSKETRDIIGKKISELTRDDFAKLGQYAPNTDKIRWDFQSNHAITNFGILDMTENAGWLQAASKIPGMNSMAIFHDVWMAKTNPSQAILMGTIIPATTATYYSLYPSNILEFGRNLNHD